MAWWIWVLGGLALLVVEVTTPGGLFAVFFGSGEIGEIDLDRTFEERAYINTEAVQLRVAEQYLAQFGQLAKTGNSLIIPSNLADVGSIIATAMNVIRPRSFARPSERPSE